MDSTNNLALYEAFRSVPKTAQRTISGGSLNGKTDINPMWRIKTLTETFGPVGFGWRTELVEHWSEEATIDAYDREAKTWKQVFERVAWVRLNLFVKDPATGEWSAAIEGIGGSKSAGKGRGYELNDEAFKMAETDAISVACKKLGIGADIYWSADATKYTKGEQAPPQQQDTPALSESDWNTMIQYAVAGQLVPMNDGTQVAPRQLLVDYWHVDNTVLAMFDRAVAKAKAAANTK